MKIITINAMWCPGCIVMHKVWNNIKKSYPNIEFISYDYDMDEEIVKTFNPGKILPITILLVDDIEKDRLDGEVSEEKIIDMIEKNK